MKKKNLVKLFGIIAIIALAGFAFAACDTEPNGNNNNNNNVCEVCGQYPSVCPQPCDGCGYAGCECADCVGEGCDCENNNGNGDCDYANCECEPCEGENCDCEDPNAVTWAVRFMNHNGTVFYTASVREGRTVSGPATAPSRTGYTFTGWDFDFTTAITADRDINARWHEGHAMFFGSYRGPGALFNENNGVFQNNSTTFDRAHFEAAFNTFVTTGRNIAGIHRPGMPPFLRIYESGHINVLRVQAAVTGQVQISELNTNDFAFIAKPKATVLEDWDAIIRVTQQGWAQVVEFGNRHTVYINDTPYYVWVRPSSVTNFSVEFPEAIQGHTILFGSYRGSRTGFNINTNAFTTTIGTDITPFGTFNAEHFEIAFNNFLTTGENFEPIAIEGTSLPPAILESLREFEKGFVHRVEERQAVRRGVITFSDDIAFLFIVVPSALGQNITLRNALGSVVNWNMHSDVTINGVSHNVWVIPNPLLAHVTAMHYTVEFGN